LGLASLGVVTSRRTEEEKMTKKLGSAALSLMFIIGGVAFAIAQAPTPPAPAGTVYNSIPNPLPGNVSSEGPEAYAFSEIGDGLALAGATGGKLNQVTVIMSSWACTNGNWTTSATPCVTKPGAT
jgi:hypothetical protein